MRILVGRGRKVKRMVRNHKYGSSWQWRRAGRLEAIAPWMQSIKRRQCESICQNWMELSMLMRWQRNFHCHCVVSWYYWQLAPRGLSACGQRLTLLSLQTTRIVHVEPGVTFDQLVTHTLRYNMAPLIVPEFPRITIGGAISGGGCESSSFRFGQVCKQCEEGFSVLKRGCHYAQCNQRIMIKLSNVFCSI